MKLICIFLCAVLAVATAKPYGVKGGYERDSDRLVQSHIPVNENLHAGRLDERQLVRPLRVESGPLPGDDGLARPIQDTRTYGRRPLHGDDGLARPIQDTRNIGRYEDSLLVRGEPLGGGGYHSRPIGGGYGGQGRIIEQRPIGGGYGDHGRIIEQRPIGGGIGHNARHEVEELGGHGTRPVEQLGGVKGGHQRTIGY